MAEAMYVRIAADLRAKIKSGKLKPGTQLPPEQGLQDEYGELFGLPNGVSRNTIRDAIELLVRERLSGNAEGGENSMYLSTVARHGREAVNTPPRVEVHSSSRAPELELGDDEQVLSRHQERFIDGKPYSLQTSYYPLSFAAMAPLLLVVGDIEEGAVAYIAENVVACMLRDQISGGGLAHGSPTPSITRLCQESGHARQTCAKAMRLLETEGLLRRVPGLGYYVN